jgi:hypothetical protein
MNGENQPLDTDEPVEFERQLIEVQDFRILPIDLENLENISPCAQK